MTKKKFEHNRKEPCNICNKEIDTKVESYSVLLDYNGEKGLSKGFYHRDCLKNIIKGNMKVVEDKWKAHGKRMMLGLMRAFGGGVEA